MDKNKFISIFFIALLLFIASQVFLILWPFLGVIFWAATVSFAFYPLYTRLKPFCGRNANVAAGSATVLIFLLFLPIAILATVTLSSEFVKLYGWVLDFIQEHRYDEIMARFGAIPFVEKLKNMAFQWEVVRDNYRDWMVQAARAVGRYAAVQATTITKDLLFLPLNILLLFFLVFFFFRDGHAIYRFIYNSTPLEEENKKLVFGQITTTFEAVIRGQLLTAVAQSTIAGIVFWILGVPLPVLFAGATFLACLVPVVGAPMVWLPLVIYLASTQHYTKAGILFFAGVFGISLIDNFLKPLVIGERTKLPYLLLFLGILGGMKVYGLLGIFLAPIFLSLFFALVKIYREKFL